MSNKNKAIICDIDGCLVNTDRIFKEILQRDLTGDEKWDYFHRFANEPSHSLKNRRLIQYLIDMSYKGYEILLVTARSEEIYKETFKYLYNNSNYVFDFKLYCRKINDYRPSWVVKEDITKDLLKDYDVIMAIDDELANCQMFESLGLLTFRYRINYAELSQ